MLSPIRPPSDPQSLGPFRSPPGNPSPSASFARSAKAETQSAQETLAFAASALDDEPDEFIRMVQVALARRTF